MHMLAQDKHLTSCKLPDNKLVMLVINWAQLGYILWHLEFVYVLFKAI